MFNTFKYDRETRQVQEIRKAFDPITARTSQHQACTNCKAKKLRCSGEKSGCERCAAGQLVCEYPRSRSRSRSTRRPGVAKRSSAENPRESSSSAAGHSHKHSPSPLSSPSMSSTTSPSASQCRQDSSSFNPLSTQHPVMMLPESGHTNQALPSNELGLQGLAAGYQQSADAMTGESAAWADYSATYPYAQGTAWQSSQTESYPANPATYLGSTATGEEMFSLYPDYTQFEQDDSHQTQYWPDES